MTNNEAPSIGGIELNFDPIGNRVRQIASDVIEQPSNLLPILREAHIFAEQHGATRRVVRAVTRSEALEEAQGVAHAMGWTTEAAIPLSDWFSGYHFVYYGRNDATRASQSKVLEQEQLFVQQASSRERRQLHTYLREAQISFTLERLHAPLSDDDYRRLIEMYTSSFSAYPFNIQAEIPAMVANPNTHVYAARLRSDGQLYAVTATEQVEVLLDNGRTLTMREMGDSAKMPNMNGLNRPLKLALVMEAALPEKVDLLFCETRAALIAVNRVNSAFMGCRGMLPKHTVISGPQDVDEVGLDGETNGRYGNMNVWALNRQDIRHVAQECSEVIA